MLLLLYVLERVASTPIHYVILVEAAERLALLAAHELRFAVPVWKSTSESGAFTKSFLGALLP